MMDVDFHLPNRSVEEKCRFVGELRQQMASMDAFEQKLDFLRALPHVCLFLDSAPSLRSFLNGLSSECVWGIIVIIAVGQGSIVFNSIEILDDKFQRLRVLLHTLLEVERFYTPIGGLIGYYHTALTILACMAKPQTDGLNEQYHYPPLIDISTDMALRNHQLKAGICAMPQMAEVYPIGGAGDRLSLCHPLTGDPLPVAQLELEGFSLLERLLLDLQGREYLYWKLLGRQLETPIVMMGSHEKNNISHILDLCQKMKWFGRAPDNFQMIVQPLVPQITEQGDFSLCEFLHLSLKPGGHGVIWKLAADEGVFDWLKAKGCHKMLIRQINNPAASVDDTLLAFIGLGCTSNRSFGFVACDRRIGAPEGMLVLKQTALEAAHEADDEASFRYAITNVEYTNFFAKGLSECPKEPGSLFSQFPANTNILFADIGVIENALQQDPLPGLLMNVKSKAPSIGLQGSPCYVPAGRLESSMQNVADDIYLESTEQLDSIQGALLPSYVMFTKRQKALSVTKNLYAAGSSFLDTPESCFFTLLENCYDLFSTHCGMNLPPMEGIEKCLSKGPPFIIRYMPLIGPLYSVIAQKIQKGTLHHGAELILNIAEVDLQGLMLSGSLKIVAKDPFGCTDPVTGKIHYSHGGGKCELHNVRIVNRGIDYEAPNCYWKDSIQRHALMEIILHGNGEFYADSVSFEGALRIDVPDGQRIEARTVDGEIRYQTFKIDAPTWHWNYSFADNAEIVLEKQISGDRSC